MAVGHIPRAPPMSEGPDRRSCTSTCRPPRTRPQATARPAMPPPTTTTFPSMPTKLKAGAPLNEPDHGVFEGHPFLKPLAVPAHCLYGLGPHLSDELREETDSSKIEDSPGISSWNDRAALELGRPGAHTLGGDRIRCMTPAYRSEERRVGKECRSRRGPWS